jgi:hypothetical protein
LTRICTEAGNLFAGRYGLRFQRARELYHRHPEAVAWLEAAAVTFADILVAEGLFAPSEGSDELGIYANPEAEDWGLFSALAGSAVTAEPACP